MSEAGLLNAWQSEIFTNVHENAHLNHLRLFDVCLEMSNDSKNQSRNLLITGKVNTGGPWRYTGGHFVKISDYRAFSTCPAVWSEQKFSKCRGDSELKVCPALDISLTLKPSQGRFHTRRRTNHLDRPMVWDRQVVCCENGTNKFSDDSVVWICLSVFPAVKTNFWRLFGRPEEQSLTYIHTQTDFNEQYNGQFACLGGMELAKEVIVCGKFAWKLAELAVLNSH